MESLVPAALGGALIGTAASLLLLWTGRVAGISGIIGGLLVAPRLDRGWRVAFLIGLLSAGATWQILWPGVFPETPSGHVGVAAIGGLLVGLGTTIGNGCTSGHGVCGLARRSPRSLAATVTFMLTAALTVYAVRHLISTQNP